MFFSKVSIAEVYLPRELPVPISGWQKQIHQCTEAYPIISITVVANIQEYITIPWAEVFLKPMKILDIQYVAKGKSSSVHCSYRP